MSKEAIKNLYDFCKSNESSGNIKDGDRYIRMIKDYVGEAAYIYAARTYYNKEHAIDLNNKFTLAAIYLKAKETCYIVDEFMFGIYHSDDFVEYAEIRQWSGYVQRVNEYQRDCVFPKFYESIVPAEQHDYAEDDLKNWARRKLLGNAQWNRFTAAGIVEGSDLTWNDCGKIISGYYSIDEVCLTALNRKRESYVGMKTRQQAINDYIEQNGAATDDEIRLAKALNDLDALTVTVEFDNNGKFAAEKMQRETIIRKLINDDYFSAYDFPTRDKGKKFLESLDAADSLWDVKKCLYAKNITKITYRGKVVYEREG